MTLTKREYDLLIEYAAGIRVPVSYGVDATVRSLVALAKKGMMTAYRQHTVGGVVYNVYTLTPAGRAALEAHDA